METLKPVAIIDHILDPPLITFTIFLVCLLAILWLVLEKNNFYVLVITLAASFLVVESACRLFNIGNPGVGVWNEQRVDGLPYHYKPNGRLSYRYPDNPRNYFDGNNEVVGQVNSMGFRGGEASFEKDINTLRVAFLGDSFTLGIGVKDEDTLPAQFEKNASLFTPDLEVLNFGVSGSDTNQQTQLFKQYVVNFEPDIVIVVLFLNDANRVGTINFLSRAMILKKVRKHSFFLNGLVGNLEKFVLHRKMVNHYQDGFNEESAGWISIKSSLKDAKSLADQQGIQLVTVIYPVLFHLDGAYPFKDIHEKLEKFCVSEGIRFVDLFGAFTGQKDSELWVHSTDQHPNEIANRLAGKFLAGKLENLMLSFINGKTE